ncbi:MAG: hypothetical protein IJH94_07655, partial [Clostridia bacterium]|nr:hypothetical protein [Clostridia bacterium]
MRKDKAMIKKMISLTAALAVSSSLTGAASEPDNEMSLRTAAETATITVKLDPSDESPSNGGE